MKLEDILTRLDGVRKSGDGWTARCPAHDDQHPSLKVQQVDGKTLLHCFAGCKYEAILAALGFESSRMSKISTQRIIAVYLYQDEKGQTLYEKVRFTPKSFVWRRYVNGKEVRNLQSIRRVPYRLPDLLTLSGDDAVIMCEGEKDADNLAAVGLNATSHKGWQREFNYILKARDCVIFQDHDKAGVAQALRTVNLICRHARAIKIVDCFAGEPLPEKHGKDVSDYLQAHSIEDLRKLIRHTSFHEPQIEKRDTDGPSFSVISLADVESKEVVWLWKPFIPLGEFTILEGIEGLGKSWLCSAIAHAVTSRTRLPFSESNPIAPSNVLLLSAEDSLEYTIKPRLVTMRADLQKILALEEVFSLDNLVDLVLFEAAIAMHRPKLVVIDPMFSYTGGRNLNQESDSRPIARKLTEIAQKYGCAIVGVRHIGKSKGNGDARAAGLGSISWRAAARSVLLVGEDTETGEKALCQTKNNLAPLPDFSVAFEIRNGEFLWKDERSSVTKEKMLAQPANEETKAEHSEALEFLQESLRDGERPSKEIEREAKQLGISRYALGKAKNTLGIRSIKRGGNFGGDKGWYFTLKDAEESDSNSSKILQQNSSNNALCNNDLAEEIDTRENQPLQRVSANPSGN